MAEGWTNHLKGDLLEAHSAGIEPHGLDQMAVEVMQEAGVDISRQHSKHVNDMMDIPFDFVITVCDHAYESCPIFPGKAKIIHIGFEDPPKMAEGLSDPEAQLNCYRKVCHKIKNFIMTLPELLFNQGDH